MWPVKEGVLKIALRALTSTALVAMVLAGCSSKDDDLPPPYPNIDNKIVIDSVWSSSVGDGIAHYDSHLSPAVADGKVFAASRAGLVSAFDLASGSSLWTVDMRDKDDAPLFGGISHWWNERNAKLAGGVSVGYGKVFIASEDGDVVALNPETGETVWRVNVKAEVLAAPTAGEGLLLVNTAGGRLLALSPENGERRWVHEWENATLTLRGLSSVATSSGGVVYGTGAGKVGVVIADKGLPAWEEPVAAPKGATDLARIIDVDATPIVQDGTIYAIAYNGQLVAMDLRSGRQMWKRDYASFRDMAVAGTSLYLVDSQGKLYAVDSRSGEEQWSQQALNKHFVTAPTVYKDYLVVGDDEGNLHWFARSNGEYLAREDYDSSGFYAEGVVSDDKLIMQTRNGEIEVLQVTE